MWSNLSYDKSGSIKSVLTLPSDIKLTEHEITNMTQHVGKHDKYIVLEIKEEVKKIRTALAEGELSKERAKER